MKIDTIKIMLFFAGLLCCNSIFASNNPPPPIPPPPPGLPIDGGLLVLMLASVILGFYKIYKHKKSFKLS